MTPEELIAAFVKENNINRTPRDPKRIKQFLAALGKCWETVPDLRFGQFVMNTFGMLGKDPFYIEDQNMIAFFESVYIKGGEDGRIVC